MNGCFVADLRRKTIGHLARRGEGMRRPLHSSRIAILLSIVIGLIASARYVAGAVAPDDLEYRVKAAFLLNFTRFVEWPPGAFPQDGSPLSICILGTDPFGPTLDQTVQGEAANGRKLVVQRVAKDSVPGACQVLFISGQERAVPKLLAGLAPGVLTVGEGDTFLKDGGIIAFVIDNRRVRFDINQAAAESAALKVSSKLMSVARLVQK